MNNYVGCKILVSKHCPSCTCGQQSVYQLTELAYEDPDDAYEMASSLQVTGDGDVVTGVLRWSWYLGMYTERTNDDRYPKGGWGKMGVVDPDIIARDVAHVVFSCMAGDEYDTYGPEERWSADDEVDLSLEDVK